MPTCGTCQAVASMMPYAVARCWIASAPRSAATPPRSPGPSSCRSPTTTPVTPERRSLKPSAPASLTSSWGWLPPIPKASHAGPPPSSSPRPELSRAVIPAARVCRSAPSGPRQSMGTKLTFTWPRCDGVRHEQGGCPMARGARGVFVALAAADTLLAGAGRDRERWLTKPLLMPVLMAGSDRGSRPALALGGAGDVALLGSSDAAFTAGLACFLVGHAAWIYALRQRPGRGRLRSRPVLA